MTYLFIAQFIAPTALRDSMLLGPNVQTLLIVQFLKSLIESCAVIL